MTKPASPIVGIDLGTTFSLVSLMQDGVPTVLPNALGELLTPSAVSVAADGTVLVGAPARARATTHPERTALAFKRDMGTSREYDLGGTRFKAPDLSALVLGALKRDAEAALGVPIEEAVITVPAYFGELQRAATRDAGRIAGLRVDRILNEPTAAALAYGLHQRAREMRCIVLDLGGGTFDVTVLEIIEGVIEIQASAGDTRLGGEDFSDAIATLVSSRIASEKDVRASAVAWARVREASELAKHRLSDSEEARVALVELRLEGRNITCEELVTRAAAEEAWAPLLERMRAPILRALRDANVRPEAIDEVLLVGGATRMPCVSRLAAQVFGRLPQRKLPPDEAVALGAAVQAALKSGDSAVSEMVVTDVAPFTLGIATMERFGQRALTGVFAPILERGTVIPASRMQRFATTSAEQRVISIEVFQGEHSMCEQNTKLGQYRVTDIPPGLDGPQPVDVRFTYDLNGLLEVETTIIATGKKQVLVIEAVPGRLTPAQVAEAREQMKRLKLDARDALPNTTALHRAEALYVELTGDPRQELGFAIGVFRTALETQAKEKIDPAREMLIALTERLRRGR